MPLVPGGFGQLSTLGSETLSPSSRWAVGLGDQHGASQPVCRSPPGPAARSTRTQRTLFSESPVALTGRYINAGLIFAHNTRTRRPGLGVPAPCSGLPTQLVLTEISAPVPSVGSLLFSVPPAVLMELPVSRLMHVSATRKALLVISELLYFPLLWQRRKTLQLLPFSI